MISPRLFLLLVISGFLVSTPLLAQNPTNNAGPAQSVQLKGLPPAGADWGIYFRFSRDGRYFFNGSQKFMFWDVSTGNVVRRGTIPFAGYSLLALSPDRKNALSKNSRNQLFLWNIATTRLVRKFDRQNDRGANAACFSLDGRYVQVRDGFGTSNLWDVKTGKYMVGFGGFDDMVNTMCFSPNSRCALVGLETTALFLYDIKAATTVHHLRGHRHSLFSVCFSPDGQYALSGDGGGRMILWSVETVKKIRTMDHKPASKGLTSVWYSPDGQYVLSADGSGPLRFWDVKTGKTIHTFLGHRK